MPERDIPPRIEDRLIVALDVPSIARARALIDRLDGIASFFKLGLWLAFAAGFDGLIEELRARGKRIFLDAKMYDIGETVKEGVARAAERGVDFLTVHGDREIMKAAVAGRAGSPLKIFAITVLTSLDAEGLADLGYHGAVEELVRLRAQRAVECGCDGIIASPRDNPDRLRRLAAPARGDAGRAPCRQRRRRPQAHRHAAAGDRRRRRLADRRAADRAQRGSGRCRAADPRRHAPGGIAGAGACRRAGGPPPTSPRAGAADRPSRRGVRRFLRRRCWESSWPRSKARSSPPQCRRSLPISAALTCSAGCSRPIC